MNSIIKPLTDTFCNESDNNARKAEASILKEAEGIAIDVIRKKI